MADNMFEEFKKDARKAGSGSLASGYRPKIGQKEQPEEKKEVKQKEQVETKVDESSVDTPEEINVEEVVDEFDESETLKKKSAEELPRRRTGSVSSGNLVREEEPKVIVEEPLVSQERVSIPKKTLKDYEKDVKSRRELKDISSLIVETEDGDYYWNTKSKTVRVEIQQALLTGVRDYLSSLYGEDIKTFSNPQLITYLLIKQLPKDIREDLANQIAVEQNGYDKVYNQIVEDLSRDADPSSLKNISRDVSMMKEELSLISSSQTNQMKEMSEMFPAVLLAVSFLAADRMDLRKKFNEGSFKNFIVKEDEVGDWMEDLLNLGYSYRSRLETKNNTQRRRNMHPSQRRNNNNG